MKKRTKFSILLIFLLLILTGVAVFFATKISNEFKSFWDNQKTVDYAKIKDVVVTETKDGIKDWEMYAATAEYNENRVIATLTDVVGNYYQNNEVVMSFTAPIGIYNSEKKEISLNESVKIVGKDNIKLTANKVYWITTEKKIRAEGDVVINKGNEVIAISDKAAVTNDLKFFEIIGNTELRVYKGKRR
ncbi:MAG: LPS export ABC transporter periplasmic protein LptC [Candidatus Gastranaerophilales bacterium]|nr:LPS export ABC transporter periplasmic protein LptC [Candidatus Gastranaerophilales bacterium]